MGELLTVECEDCKEWSHSSKKMSGIRNALLGHHMTDLEPDSAVPSIKRHKHKSFTVRHPDGHTTDVLAQSGKILWEIDNGGSTRLKTPNDISD